MGEVLIHSRRRCGPGKPNATTPEDLFAAGYCDVTVKATIK